MIIPNHCQRCKKKTNVLTMSYFNTQWICEECDEKERTHPDYKKAKDAELEALRNGDRNFPGIGKPADL